MIILRDMRNESNGSKINSREQPNSIATHSWGKRRWAEIACRRRLVSSDKRRSAETSDRQSIWSVRNVDGSQQSTKTGRLGIRIGTSGEKEDYSTLNVMTGAIERIAGKMNNAQAFYAMGGNEEKGDNS